MNEGEALKSNETGKIDILSFLNDVLNRLRSFWWVILILTLGLGAFNYFRSTTRYTPTYTAEATVAVAILHGGTYSNENTAQQMSKVFPYILTSGVLSDIIADDLGMSYVPGRISAKNIEGTNLLTISVTGSDPDKVYKVLQSVLRKYPEVARFVIGQTEITVIDDSGVPEDTGKTTVIRGSLVKGLLLGFAIGVVLLLLYTLLTRTVRSEKDLTNMLNVNYLGGLPIVRQKKKDIIQDRTIYEDAYIVAPNLHAMGYMPTRDFENYASLFELMSQFLQAPDLLIYLRADTSTLVSQIQKRGREYENSIRIDYLQNLNERYEEWISNYKAGKLLIIDVNTLKFAERAEDFGEVIEKVNAELFGLFK